MAVTLDWLGCATFRLDINGLVVFLDAYMDRVSSAPDVGLTTKEVNKADYVLVGHSHFDHLAGAEVIAHNTGAKVIGSNETARVLEQEAQVPKGQLLRAQGGEHFRLNHEVTVRVFPSLHSCIWVGGSWDTKKVVTGHYGLTEDERSAVQSGGAAIGEAPENPDAAAVEEMRKHLATSLGSREIGGALAFLIDTPDGTIFYHDTSGCWTGVVRGLRPDLALVAMAGRGNIDGEPLQGSLAQFVGQMGELLAPKTMILGHHDAWMPPMTRDMSDGASLEHVREELSRRAPRVKLETPGFSEGRRVLG
jgi:L-ascorbate metabolism protein UlaG (beta-lactamase superfamily)